MQGFKNEMSLARFFRHIVLIVLGFSLAILLGIFLIDPYNIWRQNAILGINEITLEVPNSTQMHAAVLSSALHTPDVLILGSSRVRRGFNSGHASQLFNANVQVSGIDLLPLSTATDLYSAVSKHTHIKRLYLEVNYFTSNACERFFEYPQIKELWSSTIINFNPRDAVQQSLRTLRINAFGPRIPNGYFDSVGNYHEKRKKGMGKSAPDQSVVNREFKYIERKCQRQANKLEDSKNLAALFKAAQAQGTEVTLLVLPSSPNWQACIRQAGLETVIEQWKKNISEEARQLHFRFLDFERDAGFFNSINTGNDTPEFWDSSHFSSPIGNFLLEHMARSDNRSKAIQPRVH
ncbi:hypothetical protein [Janthinobacterium lividum]|uniref:hypothetical protein n=1 Tax=Janthinobacterium lividum TaxID=29581 RepID=UPI001B815E98|nr:hypothetical protein [Janthinobacterium lividum]MBR7633309.1 hypothetical protein [Janthinobacterium lividum]